jgi:hypothetical protein
MNPAGSPAGHMYRMKQSRPGGSGSMALGWADLRKSFLEVCVGVGVTGPKKGNRRATGPGGPAIRAPMGPK